MDNGPSARAWSMAAPVHVSPTMAPTAPASSAAVSADVGDGEGSAWGVGEFWAAPVAWAASASARHRRVNIVAFYSRGGFTRDAVGLLLLERDWYCSRLSLSAPLARACSVFKLRFCEPASETRLKR